MRGRHGRRKPARVLTIRRTVSPGGFHDAPPLLPPVIRARAIAPAAVDRRDHRARANLPARRVGPGRLAAGPGLVARETEAREGLLRHHRHRRRDARGGRPGAGPVGRNDHESTTCTRFARASSARCTASTCARAASTWRRRWSSWASTTTSPRSTHGEEGHGARPAEGALRRLPPGALRDARDGEGQAGAPQPRARQLLVLQQLGLQRARHDLRALREEHHLPGVQGADRRPHRHAGLLDSTTAST